jgi:RNA polymerase sigma-70 factor (ECF subfamily)
MNQQFDHTLVQELIAGSEPAWQQLYTKYHRLLFLKAYQLLHDTEEARDIVQELFATIWEKRAKLSLSAHHIEGYLLTAVKNKCLDRIDANNVRKQHKIQFEYLHTEVAVQFQTRLIESTKEQQLRLLNTAMQTVTNDFCYPAFEGMYIEGKTSHQVAEELGSLPGTVRKRAHKIFHLLHKKLNSGK